MLFELEYIYSISNIVMLFSNFLYKFNYVHALCQIFIVIKKFCFNCFSPPIFDAKLFDYLVRRLSPIHPMNGLLLLRSRWCVEHKMLLPRARCVITM